MTNINEVLVQRGNRYGSFEGNARITQHLKFVIAEQLSMRDKVLPPEQQEALDMICHKIARIINGDNNYNDNWVDIAGYSQLVVDNLHSKETE